jgi:hypothetical protein
VGFGDGIESFGNIPESEVEVISGVGVEFGGFNGVDKVEYCRGGATTRSKAMLGVG